jgi:hypothetical protein
VVEQKTTCARWVRGILTALVSRRGKPAKALQDPGLIAALPRLKLVVEFRFYSVTAEQIS